MIGKKNKFRIFAIAFLALLFVFTLGFGIGCAVHSEENKPPVDDEPNEIETAYVASLNNYANTTVVGYSAEVIGTAERYRPVKEVTDERDRFPIPSDVTLASRYPVYGSTPRGITGTGEAQVAARSAVISESAYLCAWGTAGANRGGAQTADKYTKMDADGWLYQLKDGQWIHSLLWGETEYVPANYRRLYKHTASAKFYFGDVSDSEKGIVKRVALRPRGYSSYSVTGVYAPAGEVIKIQISGADMNANGGITVHIGQALYNGQANNIWASKNTMPRMAHDLTTLAINKSTATYDEATDTWTGYVGSFLGGPIYIRNTSVTVTATISGAVPYRHFIHGYTTPEEFAELSKSSAPYFDLEVWDKGVLHSGPLKYASSFSYDELYKAAVLWEKVSLVTTTNGSKQGIVFIYDPFVAAGAAVAFPGRSSVNCPLGWMTSSLNYSAIVTSGSWGNFHEYHHNFQNYGVSSGANGEVTNNGLNLVSYSLFTKISSARTITGYGGSGLSGWNQYTSASWVINRVNNGAITSTNGLAIYATLLHNFGQEEYIKARGTTNTNNYLNKWANNTHQDFTYFASKITAYGTGTYTPSDAVKNANYPLFVPVASVYQTGRSFNYDGEKKYIQTMQPFIIPSDKPYTVDLRKYTVNSANQYQYGSVVIGDGFDFKLKSVNANGINGTFVPTDTEGVYTFTPNSTLRSGKIYATIEITYNGAHQWNGHELQDVDLVLEFQQSREASKFTLERTIYKFSADNMYTDAVAACDANFTKCDSSNTIDHTNPTQNANTDIWFWPNTTGHENYVESHPEYFITENEIHVIDGKAYFNEDGKYRIYMRGRTNCAVYFSLNGQDYTLGAAVKNGSGAAFYPNDPNTYFDVEFDEGAVTVYTHLNGNEVTKVLSTDFSGTRWLYLKEVLIVTAANSRSYIGLGSLPWTQPQYTTTVRYYFESANGNVYVTEDAENGGYTYTSGNLKYYIEVDGTRYYYDQYGERKESGSVVVRTETHYYTTRNGSQVEVSENEANNTDYVAPEVTSKNPVNYMNIYRRNYEFQQEFESDYFYLRDYNYNYAGDPEVYSTWDEGVTLVGTNYVPETAPYGIEHLFEEGQTTYTHSKANQGKGVYITLDMGKQINANSITFLGRTDRAASTAQQGLPKSFTVMISNDGEIYEDAGTFTNSKGAVHSATVNFDKVLTFRYVKIVVNSTHSNTGRLILSGIKFTYTFTLTGNGSNTLSPDNGIFKYSKDNWKIEQATSTFGHVYVGNPGAEMKFDFEGNRFLIVSSKQFSTDYEVYIDGELAKSVTVKKDDSAFGVKYISPELAQGKHSVVIKCKSGGNIDMIATY